MTKVISIPETIYNRLARHARGFDTPAGVIERLLNHYEDRPSNPSQNKSLDVKTSSLPKRGRKGYEQIPHYIIPIIQLMKNGATYPEACKALSKKLRVDRSTVNAQCTRTLNNLSARQFVEYVESGQILNILYKQYPEKQEYIKREIGKFY